MESEKQKILMPSAGICNLTPDKVCNDNELLDSDGITFSDDALRVVRPPQKILEGTDGTLAFVHALNSGQTNYIYTQGSYFNGIDTGATITDVKAIGNMLILNTDQGLRFYLWKNGQYLPSPQIIPYPELSVSASSYRLLQHGLPQCMGSSAKNEDFYHYDETSDKKKYIRINTEQTDAFNDLIAGLYAENKKKIAKEKYFCLPFFIRAAVELQNGDFVSPGPPILIWPAVHRNTFFEITEDNIKCLTQYSDLSVAMTTDYSAFGDLVKNVVLFATPPVEINVIEKLFSSAALDQYVFDAFTSGALMTDGYFTFQMMGNSSYKIYSAPADSNFFPIMDARNATDIINDITSSATFFKICELGKDKTQYPTNLKSLIQEDGLENLTSATRLEHDGFYDQCPLYPSIMETFNRRLNISGVRRGFFNGYKEFMLRQSETISQYNIYVYIETDNGEIIVRQDITTSSLIDGGWFFYPDTRAKHALIVRNGTPLRYLELKEHPRLNGAYHIDSTLPSGDNPTTGDTTSPPSPSVNPSEPLQNYIIQSEVDNPFTFLSSGYVRVGQGTIIGMAALTTALSQDAYKVATTIAFTTQGIWALTNDSTGQYAAVAPPFSREVCNNPASITMADNTVFFTSDKGLMMITDNGIKNVTHQLSGKVQATVPDGSPSDITPFRNFLKTCRCAYDYRNNHLWLLPPPNSQISAKWIYNINSGAVTRITDNNQYKAIVPNYPDTLLQTTDGRLFSMNQRPDINDDTNTYSAMFITRPVKFNDSVRLKTIREFLHIHDLSQGAELNVTIYGSNDCRQWHTINSLYGSGFKFFSFKYQFNNLHAVDTFSGTLIGYDLRQTNKLR